MPGIIENDADVATGAAWLAAQDPRFDKALRQTGPLPLRRRDGGFAALLEMIVSQQISVAAARGVWARLENAGATDAGRIARMSGDDLRGLGLSKQKAAYAKALALADIDYDALAGQPTRSVVKTLTQVKGIGVWTAEIYAMFSLGHADVLAAGDLALQEAAKVLFDLPERPDDRALRQMALAWSPWRAVAARLLWSYYHVIKDREGI